MMGIYSLRKSVVTIMFMCVFSLKIFGSESVFDWKSDEFPEGLKSTLTTIERTISNLAIISEYDFLAPSSYYHDLFKMAVFSPNVYCVATLIDSFLESMVSVQEGRDVLFSRRISFDERLRLSLNELVQSLNDLKNGLNAQIIHNQLVFGLENEERVKIDGLFAAHGLQAGLAMKREAQRRRAPASGSITIEQSLNIK